MLHARAASLRQLVLVLVPRPCPVPLWRDGTRPDTSKATYRLDSSTKLIHKSIVKNASVTVG